MSSLRAQERDSDKRQNQNSEYRMQNRGIFNKAGIINDKFGRYITEKAKKLRSIKVDEAALGGRVNYQLLKQAIVMYHANKRVGTAATKNKSLVEGSTRKLYKQKHTGNARAGQVRTAKRVGGGVTFEKKTEGFR